MKRRECKVTEDVLKGFEYEQNRSSGGNQGRKSIGQIEVRLKL